MPTPNPITSMTDPRDPVVIRRLRPVSERPATDISTDADTLTANDAVDRAVETFGLNAVIRALRMVLWANGINTWQRTVDDLAEGSEKQ